MDKVIDAVDEWFHRHGFGLVKVGDKRACVTPWWGWLVKPLCDLRERRYLRKDWVAFESEPTTTATSANTLTTIRWNVAHPHKGRKP